MKKMLSLMRWPCLRQDVPSQTFTVQKQTLAAVAPKETITHHFFVSGIGQKGKTVDAAKICGGAEKMLLKQKPSKHS